ncbi:hypothetical protein [Enterobacter kobei]|uniref:hypothetical protein n=1 Tax=Enterobacter kobei TaxID=208224 RepID=UPI003D6F6798
MSTITKEFTKEQLIEKLQRRVAVTANYPDVEEAQLDAAIFKIALASLEAEPVCVIDQSNLDYLNAGSDADVWPVSRTEMGDVLLYRTAPPAPANAEPVAWLWSHRKHPSEVSLVRPEDDEKAEGAHWSWWSCQALYAAPPAPVSVPDAMEMDDDFDSAFEHGKAVGWNAYRAAMLQSFGNSEQLNSPVIPDGWVLVPIEPTEHMIVEGFESEPDEFFSDEEVWEAYDAMSGCQQAAHRAKLCWAAMIKAAPKLE